MQHARALKAAAARTVAWISTHLPEVKQKCAKKMC
jgi:hypothetical protein